MNKGEKVEINKLVSLFIKSCFLILRMKLIKPLLGSLRATTKSTVFISGQKKTATQWVAVKVSYLRDLSVLSKVLSNAFSCCSHSIVTFVPVYWTNFTVFFKELKSVNHAKSLVNVTS